MYPPSVALTHEIVATLKARTPGLNTLPPNRIHNTAAAGLLRQDGMAEHELAASSLRRLRERLVGANTPANHWMSPDDRRYGQPLRSTMDGGPPTHADPTPAELNRWHHRCQALRTAQLGTAATIAAARYDTFSPWRQWKARKRPSADCPYCGSPDATARHLLSVCPQFALHRADTIGALPAHLRPVAHRLGTTHLNLPSTDVTAVANAIATLTRRVRQHLRHAAPAVQ